MSPYEYSPIWHLSTVFRVFHIYPSRGRIREEGPSDKTSPIVGRIDHVSWTAEEPYDALSYVWGPADKDREVLVDLVGTYAELRITPAVEEALRSLRHPTDTVTLFCDQICINQNDNQDKEYCVQLMGSIYKHATTVYAALGSPMKDLGRPDATHMYLEFGNRIGQYPAMQQILNGTPDMMDRFQRYLANKRKGDLEERPSEFAEILAVLEAEKGHFPTDGVVDFYCRPWFRRIWIVQEACLASNLEFVYGKHRCSCDGIQMALLFFYFLMATTVNNYDPQSKELAQWMRIMKESYEMNALFRRILVTRKALLQSAAVSKWKLYDLVKRYNVVQVSSYNPSGYSSNLTEPKWRSTDPRDCIYGLLGIVTEPDAVSQMVNPRYRDSVHTVYTYFASKVVARERDIILLAQQLERPECTDDEPLMLPSWVPDWSANLHVPYCFLDLNVTPFHAGRREKNDTDRLQPIEVRNSILGIRGHCLGSLELIGRKSLKPDPELLDLILDESVYEFYDEITSVCTAAAKKQGYTQLSKAKGLQEAAWLLPTGGWGLSLGDNRWNVPPLEPTKYGRPLLAQIHEQYYRRSVASVNLRKRYQATRESMAWQQAELAKMPRKPVIPTGPLPLLIPPSSVFLANSRIWTRYLALGAYFGLLRFYPVVTKAFANVKALLLGRSDLDRLHIKLGIGRADDDESNYPYRNALWKNMGRKLFMTSSGQVGLGPEAMSAGDLAVVLQGASSPCVLRRASRSQSRETTEFYYIGEAYCHGYMYGEALQSEGAGKEVLYHIR